MQNRVFACYNLKFDAPRYNAGHPGSKQPHVKRVALFKCHGQLNEGSTKVLMFPFATPCKAREFQSKQLNLIIFGLCRFIPAYKAELSRHLPAYSAYKKSRSH
jgi:hypothetical protein